MCQATQPAVDSRKIIADRIGASSTVEVLPTRKLNPSALEFVSSRSESEASSIADPAESEENSEPEDRIAVSDPPTKSGPNTHTNRPGSYYMDQNGSYSEDHHRYRSHPAFGWESPQVNRLFHAYALCLYTSKHCAVAQLDHFSEIKIILENFLVFQNLTIR